MQIIFNEKEVAARGNKNDANNTPRKLVNRRRAMLKKLGEFIGADIIEYEDVGNGEIYKVTKGGKVLSINVCSNRVDGGYLLLGE
jgi:hypothetical protein